MHDSINGRTYYSSEPKGFRVTKQENFSQSLLWELQRQYFARRGVNAWRQGEVPHYISSNPTVANSYAEMVVACWRDQNRLIASNQPFYLCELGAGSGRLAFHFLMRLAHLCQQSQIPLTSFRYVLTDYVQSNLDYWIQHPRFQPFFESGILDIALFDVNHDELLTLQLSGITISPQSLQRPLVAIANYLFDSIPQELYYLNNRQTYRCLVSLYCDRDPETLDPDSLLEHLNLQYDYQLAETQELEPQLHPLLTYLQQNLTDTHLLFPSAGLLCLQRLQQLSSQGLLLLSADKGSQSLANLQSNAPPQLITHGSFSLSVNYPIFQLFCEQMGGVALMPEIYNLGINIVCLIMCHWAKNYLTTQEAYQRHVREFGPGDFYQITKHARQYIDQMTWEDILAYLRLSYYDSHQFSRYLPRLLELAPTLYPHEQIAMREAIERVWQLYFPLGENGDLASEIASLFYKIGDYASALTYFQRSTEVYGQHPDTLINMAVCYRHLNQDVQADALLHQVLRYEPDNHKARTLLSE